MTRLEIRLIAWVLLPLGIGALVLMEAVARFKGLSDGWRVALDCFGGALAGAVGAEIINKLRAKWER